MNRNQLSIKYHELKPKFDKLGINVIHALETFLKENEIPFLSIQYRIKEFESFFEKIARKKYENPFDEIEDICGIRIICYYQSDIQKIQDIITNEFLIKENQNKEELLEATEFGYRSTHLIAQINKEWTKAPNYRNLGEFKFEVQVRTILMHSWAGIEHKLSYKSETHIPKNLRRKFSLISAKLEESDSQFEEIKNTIEQNKKLLIDQANFEKRFDYLTEFNLDTLQAFLDFAFPERRRDLKDTTELFNEMVEYGISFEDLVKGYEHYNEIIKLIEKETIERIEYSSENNILFAQSGATRTLFQLINDKYFKEKAFMADSDLIEKYII